MQCMTNYWPILKDIVLTITPIVGVYAALKGLSTWDRQLKGSVEYELARRILNCTYRVREAIKHVRKGVMFLDETSLPEEINTQEMSVEKKRFLGRQFAYQKRWDKVISAKSALQTELLEAEVVWGKDILEKFDALESLENELWRNIYTTLAASNPDESPSYRSVHEEMLRNQRNITYDYLTQEDEYTHDVNRAIEEIESYLKPHLRK